MEYMSLLILMNRIIFVVFLCLNIFIGFVFLICEDYYTLKPCFECYYQIDFFLNMNSIHIAKGLLNLLPAHLSVIL